MQNLVRASLRRCFWQTASSPFFKPQGERNLLTFVLSNFVAGFFIGIAVAGGLLAADTGGLRTLISNHSDVLTPLFMLFAGFGSTFGGAVAAGAVMLIDATE